MYVPVLADSQELTLALCGHCLQFGGPVKSDRRLGQMERKSLRNPCW